MVITDAFKQAIGDRFYDKSIDIYATENVVNAHGGATKSATTVSGTFMGNVNFKNLEKVQEQYGIREVVDVAITTNYNLPNDSVIGYLGRRYKIIKALPFDSHYMLIGKQDDR